MRTLRQRRRYSDDSLRLTPEQYFFPPREVHNEEESAESSPIRRVPAGKTTQLGRPRPWGLGTDDSESKTREEQVVQNGTDASEDVLGALWEQFEQAEEAEPEQAQEQAVEHADLSRRTYWDESLLDIDYVSELLPALMSNSPDMVARCLFAAARRDDLDFIRSIPNTAFAECIRILQPSNFIDKLASAHVEISEAMTRQLGIASMRRVAWEHSNLLQEVFGIRRSAGLKFGLAEYRMLLRSARDLGSKGMAVKLWMNLQNDGFTPDTDCYNSYMAASVWNGIHSALGRHKVRVIPHFQLARRTRRPGVAFANYRGGTGGLKAQILQVFGEMLKNGAVADEESFRNVITAAAREGDTATVKSVLHKVWDIEVGALQSGTIEASVTSKPIDKDSPLRPTSKLLFTIAHAFGINNDIPTALRVVDFVAGKYDIKIGVEVWKQLFEWTFVLATPRTGVKARTDGTRAGQLPKQSVLSLWETMTAAPYFVEPTIGMYNHLIKNLQHRSWTPLVYDKMCEGLQLSDVSRSEAQRAYHKLKAAVERGAADFHTAAALESRRREFEHLDLLRKRDLFWVKRWLRLLLSTTRSWIRVDRAQGWAVREVPRVLWEWRRFAPSLVRYDGPSGSVEIRMRSEDEILDASIVGHARKEERRRVLEKVPVLVGGDWMGDRHPLDRRRRRGREVERRGEAGNEQ